MARWGCPRTSCPCSCSSLRAPAFSSCAAGTRAGTPDFTPTRSPSPSRPARAHPPVSPTRSTGSGQAPSKVVAEAEATVAAEVPQPVPQNRDFALDDAPVPSNAETFRLQGIFYRPSRPSAVVNSQTVYVGDTVGSGKVKAITRENVTLIVDGESKVLTLR